MGSDGTTAVTPGTGANVKRYAETAGDLIQYIRYHRGSAISLNSWTVTTAGQASQIAADVQRTGVTIVSAANARVYLRWDSTIPVPATPAYHYYLDPGDRYELPDDIVHLAVSMAGASAGGTILSVLRTAA